MVAIDGHDAVAGAQPSLLCRAWAFAEAVDRRDRVAGRRVSDEIADVAGADKKDHQQKESQQEMYERTGQSNGQTSPRRLVAVGPGFVGRVHLFDVGHADDPAITAEGQGFYAISGLTLGDGPHAWPETNEKLGHFHARPLGRHEVAELVEDDHHQQPEDDQDSGQSAEISRYHQAGNNYQGQPEQCPPLLAGSIMSELSAASADGGRCGRVAVSTTES